MPNSIRFHKDSACPNFYQEDGTSSHCVSLTTPGAENTNNSSRGRRLGPRWDRRQPSARSSPASVVVEIRSPSKSPQDASTPQHETKARRDAGQEYPSAPEVSVRMSSGVASEHGISVAAPSEASLPIRATNRLYLLWKLGLAGALTALIALGGLAWLSRAKRTDFTVDTGATLPATSRPNSTAPLPLMKQPLPNPAVAQSGHQSTAALIAHNQVGLAASARQHVAAKPSAAANTNSLVDRANDYLRSEGVPRGCAKAMPLLTKAANSGSVRARNRLASMFAVGSCVQRNPLQAYRWMTSALELDPHNEWAKQNRQLMLRQMTSQERSRVQSSDY